MSLPSTQLLPEESIRKHQNLSYNNTLHLWKCLLTNNHVYFISNSVFCLAICHHTDQASVHQTVFRFISHVLDNTHISASQSELVTVLAGMHTWLRANHKLEGYQVMLQSLIKALEQNLLSSFFSEFKRDAYVTLI